MIGWYIIVVETMNSLRSWITIFPTEMHPSKVLTKVTWDLIMSCCPNLLTLCIEGTIVNNLTGINNLPSSIEQIYMSDCHGNLTNHQNFKKCKKSITLYCKINVSAVFVLISEVQMFASPSSSSLVCSVSVIPHCTILRNLNCSSSSFL